MTDKNSTIKTHLTSIQTGLFVLAVLYTLYFAQSLLLPIVIALLIALLLSPLVALCKRFHIPRPVSALLFVALLLGPFTLLGIGLADPVQKWARLLPEVSEQISEKIDNISSNFNRTPPPQQPVQPTKPTTKGFSIASWFGFDKEEPEPLAPPVPEKTQNPVTEQIKQSGLKFSIALLSSAPVVLMQIIGGLFLVLFLLTFGPNLFASFTTNFPQFRDKHQIVSLVSTIQEELSRYILTVSIINAGLGACTGVALHYLGLEDALLWGVMVGLLNFAPYVGSLIGAIVLCIAGLAQYGLQITALLPLAIYLLLNLVESQIVTPIALGRRLRLNPLVVMIWLIIWGWLWGMLGVLLAVPLLVCIKIILDKLDIWPQWVRIIETPG